MTTLNLDGYTDVPNGKIAFVVTFLEMHARPAPRPVTVPAGLTLRPWIKPEPEAYLPLFRAIGEEWMWFSRLLMPRARLQAILSEETRTIHVAELDGRPLGLVELILPIRPTSSSLSLVWCHRKPDAASDAG